MIYVDVVVGSHQIVPSHLYTTRRFTYSDLQLVAKTAFSDLWLVAKKLLAIHKDGRCKCRR
jgi:hypothetical protein